MHKQNTRTFGVIVFILLVFTIGCKKKTDQSLSNESLETAHNEAIEKHKSSDPLYLKYEDSLKTYFGDLEIDLIIHYIQSHNNLKTEQDFANFYRNTTTLKQSLHKRLHQYVREEMKDKKPHPINWFSELADGLYIGLVHDSTAYEIFFNYDVWTNLAQSTSGDADDQFVTLLKMTYTDHSYLPQWITPVNEYEGCSQLGSGKHFEVLKQINATSAQSHLFVKDIAKVKNLVMTDLLFHHQYCSNAKSVIKEVKQVIDEVELKETEKKMLNGRIQQFSEPEKYKIQFSCDKSDCDYTLQHKKGA